MLDEIYYLQEHPARVSRPLRLSANDSYKVQGFGVGGVACRSSWTRSLVLESLLHQHWLQLSKVILRQVSADGNMFARYAV